MDPKLEHLLAEGIIDEVLGRLQSGKEADLWIVRHAGEAVAAKIYKERQDRRFRNNADYKEGRVVANSRTQRAIERGSRFGQAAAEEAWKSAEADALHLLHGHGVRTPAPVMFFEGVLLMQLVVDATGRPAPRLIDVHPTRESATEIYRDLRAQVVRMLDCDVIHGDLSPYNVLVGAAGPTIIDFPQIIAAAKNSRSEFFFSRDLENLRRHLSSFDPGLQRHTGDAREIWTAYARRELTPDFVPSGRGLEKHGPHHPPPRSEQRNPAHDARGRPVQRQPQPSSNPARRGPRPPPNPSRGTPGPVVERVARLPSGPADVRQSSPPIAATRPPGLPATKPTGEPGAPAHHRHRRRRRHRGHNKPAS
jgi:RIO kinase 1